MAKIVFYCNDTQSSINTVEYYAQDVTALKDLGHEVFICTRYRDMPLRFDLIFIWWWSYALWPIMLAKLLRRPAIVTGVFNFRHEQPSAIDYFKRPWWQRTLLKSALLQANMNLLVSKGECEICRVEFPHARITYYPCSVGREYRRDRSGRQELLLFNICWAGRRNLERKGVFVLLDAIALLARQGHHVTLLLAGKEGDGSELLHNKITELKLSGNVQMLGEISKDEKLRLLSTCAIYVQPSFFEGFGLATAEAMACGACVITCDVGEVRTVVGDAAIYVKPGDPAGLAAAIKRAMSDAAFRSAMQELARERMHNNFSYQSKLTSLSACLAQFGIVSTPKI